MCQQRKVRCDRQKPRCSNCVKARAECIPSTPAVPRRRRRKLSELDVAARLRKYEHLLRVNGIQFNGGESGSANASGNEDANAGAGAADGSRFNRQEKTSDPRLITSKGRKSTSGSGSDTRTIRDERCESQNESARRQARHGPHELHGNHSLGRVRDCKAGNGQLFSKHGNSRYIEKYGTSLESLITYTDFS